MRRIIFAVVAVVFSLSLLAASTFAQSTQSIEEVLSKAVAVKETLERAPGAELQYDLRFKIAWQDAQETRRVVANFKFKHISGFKFDDSGWRLTINISTDSLAANYEADSYVIMLAQACGYKGGIEELGGNEPLREALYQSPDVKWLERSLVGREITGASSGTLCFRAFPGDDKRALYMVKDQVGFIAGGMIDNNIVVIVKAPGFTWGEILPRVRAALLTNPANYVDECRVEWKSRAGKMTGYGQYSDPKNAQKWVEYANGKYPSIEHWLGCRTVQKF